MKRLLVLVSVFILPGCGPFAPEVKWNCGEQITLVAGDLEIDDNLRPILKASVTISGRESPAMFESDGLELNWWFGDEYLQRSGLSKEFLNDYLEENGQSSISGRHNIQVSLDGTGRYYDFTDIEDGESISPTQTFECERE